MHDATRALVVLSATIAHGQRDELEIALAEAGQRATPAQVEEAILQSYLFAGYPAALQAIGRWREMKGGAAPAASPSDWEAWRTRGAEVFAAVYGAQAERLLENVRTLQPDLAEWMLVEGYGKVLGRPGLELSVRELCIVALLVPQDAPQQLYSHVRGALRVGNSVEDVEETLRVAGTIAGPERASAAGRVYEMVRARYGAES